jgi:hypothetical protein
MQTQRHELQTPLARTEGLLHTRLSDELVIYDMQRNKAHSLNRVATLVWQHCDGQTSVQQLCELLTRELPERVDEQLVWLALQQLERNHLLQERVGMPSNVISRREAARRFGKLAGIVLPLVASAMIPPAVAAVTCIPLYGACTFSADCCDGQPCTSGHCGGLPPEP